MAGAGLVASPSAHTGTPQSSGPVMVNVAALDWVLSVLQLHLVLTVMEVV